MLRLKVVEVKAMAQDSPAKRYRLHTSDGKSVDFRSTRSPDEMFEEARAAARLKVRATGPDGGEVSDFYIATAHIVAIVDIKPE